MLLSVQGQFPQESCHPLCTSVLHTKVPSSHLVSLHHSSAVVDDDDTDDDDVLPDFVAIGGKCCCLTIVNHASHSDGQKNDITCS